MTPFTLHNGDCLAVMRTLADCSVDSIVCDPPYELTGARPGGRSAATEGKVMKGFMGMAWDGSGVAFNVDVWREALRVLKPGGHLLAFSGTRTSHRMVCAIEDAGFEIRDSIPWIFGSGFPKSRNIATQDMDGAEAEQWAGWGSALKPAHEPCCMARKPLIGTIAANVLAHGTGALNVDGCRITSTDAQLAEKYASVQSAGARANSVYGADNRDRAGSAPHDGGRWPANIIHDGSPEVLAIFPESDSKGGGGKPKSGFWGNAGEGQDAKHDDAGSAARFFYCAKASRADRNEGLGASSTPAVGTDATMREREIADWPARNGNHHPTVKPTDLMAYLVRLVTPPGGLVLDPFMGSGSTGKACMREGFRFVGIDLSAEYVEIARARIEHEIAAVAARAAAAQEAADLAARQIDLFAEAP